MEKNNKKLMPKILSGAAALLVLVVGWFIKDYFGISDSGNSSGGTSSVQQTTTTPPDDIVTVEAEESAPSTTAAVTTKQTSTTADTRQTATAKTTTAKQTTTVKTTTTAAPVESEPETVWYEFRYYDTYESHYYKHRDEFTHLYGEITMEDYLLYANDLIADTSDDVLHKTEKEDGDYLFFRKSTEEFLVLSTDGYIRTYFIPSAGLSYFERQ